MEIMELINKIFILSLLIIFSSVYTQSPDLSKTDKNLINTVKILRGERSVLKSKALAIGAGIGSAAGLTAASPHILDPEQEIQFYREPRERDETTTEYLLNLGEKVGIVGISSAIVGTGAGAIYSKLKKHYILSTLNAFLRAYTNYPSFESLSLPQSVLIYAAYLQDFTQLASLAKAMPAFLNEKGIFNIITSLYFGQHATYDLLNELKKRLDLPNIEIKYLPDLLAKPSLWQKIQESGHSGTAKVKAGMEAIGSGMSKLQKRAFAPFQLNYISEKELDKYINDSSQFDVFLETYNPNVFVGTLGGYITGYNATPVLGYAIWHGKDNFADFLIKNDAKLHDPRMQVRTLYNKKRYANYLELAIDRKRFNIIKKLLNLGFKIGNKELKRAFTSSDSIIRSYFKDVVKDTNLLKEGVLPLNIAVSIGDKDLVKSLLDPTNINSVDSNGNTALYLAAHRSNINLVKLLLENGASSNIKNDRGNTPLHRTKDSDTAKLLIQNGASTNAKNNNSEIPLYMALGSKDKKLIEELAKGVDFLITDKDNNTLLHQAVKQINNDFAEQLMNQKPSLINKMNNNNETPLAIAMRVGNNNIADKLLTLKANVNTQDRYGTTPLLESIAHNNVYGAKLLLKHNVNPNISNNIGHNALHQALKYKQFSIIGDLIDHGALINKIDSHGNYPLHIAVSHQAPSNIITMLISPNNINALNNGEKTPLHLAEDNRVLSTLLQAGANPNITLNNNDTLLHDAAKKLNQDKISRLIRYRAKTEFANSNGNTPLHEALKSIANSFFIAKNKAVGIVRNLINPYIINTINNNGETPLILAAQLPNTSISEAIIKILYNYGARADVPDSSGKYPHEYAKDMYIRKLLGYIPQPSPQNIKQHQKTSSSSNSNNDEYKGYPSLD